MRTSVIRRAGVTTAVLAATVALSAGPALAASPHFHYASAVRSGDNLVVSFKEAGLGNTAVQVTASATATATWGCFNGGGKNPSAANKRTFTSTVSRSGVFTPRNGQITGSLTVLAPATPANFCPSGQTMRRMSLSYTNVMVTDATSNKSISVAGTF